jgi:hypothetical protein
MWYVLQCLFFWGGRVICVKFCGNLWCIGKLNDRINQFESNENFWNHNPKSLTICKIAFTSMTLNPISDITNISWKKKKKNRTHMFWNIFKKFKTLPKKRITKIIKFKTLPKKRITKIIKFKTLPKRGTKIIKFNTLPKRVTKITKIRNLTQKGKQKL